MPNRSRSNIFAWGNYQIGGGVANQAASYLDGGPLNVNYGNLTALVPTQDAISEFRVPANHLSPEFGRFSGGVANLSTKSGTNRRCFTDARSMDAMKWVAPKGWERKNLQIVLATRLINGSPGPARIVATHFW